MQYFIGIDSSTTATKALLIDEQGDVVAVAATEYGYETPRPLWSEQDPSLWWDGAANSIRQVLAASGVKADDVHGIGLTGQMHGLVLLDETGAVLRPAILWNDQRTGPQCDEIRRRLGKPRLIQITGNDALTGFTAPKILWVQQNEPEVWARARHILLPKDYVRYKLTGDYAIDKADGAGMLLFDLKQRDWSPDVLAALDIPPDYLPLTHEGPAITGYVSHAAAAATGLRVGIPVMAGGGDQAAGAVGVGAVQPGVVSLALGTSGVVFATTSGPFVEPEGRLHAFCHAVPGRWHFMGVMLSAAGSLRWHRDTFAPGVSFDDLLAPAAAVPIGCEGLLFLPYLTGERTPHPDPLARGAFVGLTVRHSLPHLDARRDRGCLLWPARQLRADQERRRCGHHPGARLGRRRQEPAVAADPGRHHERRVGHRQHHRRRGLWCGPAGGGGCGRVARRRQRVPAHDPRHGEHAAEPGSRNRIRALVPGLSWAVPGFKANL